MAVISSIIAGVTAAATAVATAASTAAAAIGTGLAAVGSAIGTAASAVSGFLGTTLFTIGGGVATSGGVAGATVGGLSVTVGGALAAMGAVTSAAITMGSMYHSARASAKAQQAQMDALTKLYEQQGELEVNKTANGVKDNSRMGRTLSSLRISMLPQANSNNKEQMTQTVYGVDTNNVATSTQNMTGLNIATA